jgi:Carboxypeptidase regulatory-like domain
MAAACLLSGASLAEAAALSGVVKDPSGAVVNGAAIAVQPGSRGAALNAVTDAQGRFHFDDVAAGSYTLSVQANGFEPWQRQISVAGKPVEIAVALKLKSVTTSVQVSGGRSPLANSDPNYQALRGGKLTKVYRVQNLTLTRDAGAFNFRSGSFSFLPPVLGHVTTGVFVGDGHFHLTPAFDLAVKHLQRRAGVDAVDEDFTALVVYFSDGTFDEIKAHSELVDDSLQPHEQAFARVKETLERRRFSQSSVVFSRGGARGMPSGVPPPIIPRQLTMLENLLSSEDIPNYEAEVLAELYNGVHDGSFRAFLHGTKLADLRFLMNPRGAMPVLNAPEETALINFAPNSENEGIWYLSHQAAELNRGHASSSEEKRLIVPEHYKIETIIGKDNAAGKDAPITVTCDLRFHSVADGTRMAKFDLLPDLQVNRVAWNGKEIPFIQEGRKQDGSFYLQMPEALVKGRAYTVSFEYSGNEILRSDLGAVSPRRLWYPRPSGGMSRATYDLRFHVPHGMTIVSTGKYIKTAQDGAFDVSEWSATVPVEFAAFKYLGDFFGKYATEETTNIDVGAYIDASGRGNVPSPSRENVLIDTGNSLRVFTHWFGPPSLENLSVIVGPTTDSVPGIVYSSPINMMGYAGVYSMAMSAGVGRGRPGAVRNAQAPPPGLVTILDEAFPRQVSRQWWGSTVGAVSLHDNWLSAGFADFSTTLYDLAAYVKPDQFREHWDKAREALLYPNRFGVRPNDAGPIWMGLLNESYKTAGASNIVNASKGAFILHMLRGMMLDAKAGDKDFQAMMHDYVKTYANQSASTEDFKWIVEKHMKPAMDLEGNHRMDWFFNEWVYGTEVPSYHLEYSVVAPVEKGSQPIVTGKLTQSGVSPTFKMRVPVYGEFENKKITIGSLAIAGNNTVDFKVAVPEVPKKLLLNVNHDILTDKEDVKRTR